MYLQTGDVLYKQVKSIPKGAKKIPGNLIHKGEQHHHAINGNFVLFQKGEEIFIEAKTRCQLLHEEHATVVLPKGKYQKYIVLEYDHWKEESRRVVD